MKISDLWKYDVRYGDSTKMMKGRLVKPAFRRAVPKDEIWNDWQSGSWPPFFGNGKTFSWECFRDTICFSNHDYQNPDSCNSMIQIFRINFIWREIRTHNSIRFLNQPLGWFTSGQGREEKCGTCHSGGDQAWAKAPESAPARCFLWSR